MGLFDWFTRHGAARGGHGETWRKEWKRAVAARDASAPERLRAALDGLRRPDGDVELEEEMLAALERMLALDAELGQGRLPLIDTTHRVVGADACHFTAPVSIPDDPAQPSGRLLLTATRAIFVGGARLQAIPWHAARQAVHADRDLLVVRGNGSDGVRFRCNSYTDALSGEAIANHLILARRTI